MRKFLFLLVFALLVSSVSAQDNPTKKLIVSPTIEAAGSFNLGLYNKSIRNSLQVQRSVLYSGGVLLGVDFQPSHGIFMLQVGVMVSNNDYTYNYNGDKKFSSLFLDVPIVFGYAYRINKNFSVSASAGVVIRNLLKYDLSVKFNPPIEMNEKTIEGIYGSVGFFYHATPHLILRIDPFFEYYWKQYSSSGRAEFAKSMSSPVIGLKFALKINLLKIN